MRKVLRAVLVWLCVPTCYTQALDALNHSQEEN